MPLILLIIALFILPGVAFAQDTCTFTGNDNMDEFAAGACTAGVQGSVSCGASCDDGDNFVVPSGITVTIDNDLTCDSTSGCGWTVQSGGTLTSIMAAGTTTPRTIAVGDLNCQAGSTCTFTGTFLENGVASPGSTLTPTLASNAFYVPNPSNEAPGTGLQPCVDNDCSTQPNIMRFSWTENAGGAAGDRFLGDALANLATGQVVWFWDDSPSGYVGADTSAPYLIEDEEALALEFDVRQGAWATMIPFNERDLISGTVNGAHGQGAREINVGNLFDTGSVESDRNDVSGITGRWIRFEDGAGNPLPRAYKIMQTDNNGADDIIRLGDLRGVDRDIATGDDYWIDYGWAPGDPFLIVVPVRIQSATSSQDAFDFDIDGAYTLRAVMAEAFNIMHFQDDSTGTADYVWNIDSGIDLVTGGSMQIDNDSQTYNWWAVTSGNGDECLAAECTGSGTPCTCCTGSGAGATCENRHHHHWVWGDEADGGTIADSLLRHSGDDFFSRNNGGGAADKFTLLRTVMQFAPEESPSAECWTSNDVNGVYAAKDVSCEGAAWNSTGAVGNCNTAVQVVAPTIPWPAQDGVMLWAGGACSPNDKEGVNFSNMIWIGTRNQNMSDGAMTATTYRNFIIRDVESLTTNRRWMQTDNNADRPKLYNGMIVNVKQDTELLGTPLVQSNVAWIDYASTDPSCSASSCRIHHYSGTALGADAGWLWENVTYAWRQATPANLTRILSWSSSNLCPDTCIMRNMLWAGLPEETVNANQNPFQSNGNTVDDFTWDGAACFYDNHFKGSGVAVDADLAAELVTQGTTVIRDVDPGFVDLEHYDVEIAPHSPMYNQCGAKTGAGISTPTWAMRRAKLPAECVGCSSRGSLGGGGGAGRPLAY